MAREQQGSYVHRKTWIVRWFENGRRQQRSGFATKREAHHWFDDEVRPRLRGRRRASSAMTLREFTETWLRAHGADVEPGTIATLRYRLAHALREFGDVPLSDLERRSLEIAGWRAGLPERRRYPATSALRQAFEAAIRWELLTENPAKKAGKNPQPKAREILPLTYQELDLLVGEPSPRDAALIVFAVETGLRPCEWLALERRDVDRVASVVLVEREYVDGQTKPYGKTAASRRRVPLTPEALGAIDELPSRLDTRLLFPGARGGYLNLRNWRSRVGTSRSRPPASASASAGTQAAADMKADAATRGCSCTEYRRSTSSPTPYVLRHTYASNSLAAGNPTFDVARYMGTSVEMIERTYGHLVAGSDDAYRRRLEAFRAARTGAELAHGEEVDSH